MKRLIPLILILLLLCGCGKVAPADNTPSDTVSDYATQYLEYADAESYAFNLGHEAATLKLGDTLGDFKLERLQSRTDETGVQGVRASFSCEITVSGVFTHLQNSHYGQLMRFYPDEKTTFPLPDGYTLLDDWIVILEHNNPADVLGFDEKTPSEITATVKITSYTINSSPANTVRYIEIAAAE